MRFNIYRTLQFSSSKQGEPLIRRLALARNLEIACIETSLYKLLVFRMAGVSVCRKRRVLAALIVLELINEEDIDGSNRWEAYSNVAPTKCWLPLL